MRNILITIKKELRSIFRDKKTVITMFIYPILIPCMVMLYGNIGDSVDEEGLDTKIGVNYELSVDEKAILDEMKLDYITYSSKDEMNNAYKNNEINCYISYENDKYIVYVNESNTDGMVAGEMASSYLEAYNSVLTSKYLIEKGIDVEEAYNQKWTYIYRTRKIIDDIIDTYMLLGFGVVDTTSDYIYLFYEIS